MGEMTRKPTIGVPFAAYVDDEGRQVAVVYLHPDSPGGGGGSGSVTNISITRDANQVNVLSSDGSDGVIPVASETLAGIMSASLFSKLLALPSSAIATSEKGANNGVATLDSSGKIPLTQVPGSVDDVLEFATQAAFPATGTTQTIYIALNDNTGFWRWSGSAYVKIGSGPGSTDAVAEGSTNLYYTDARVRAATLTGLSTASTADVVAGDTVLAAFGKLQAKFGAIAATIRGTVLTGLSTATATDVAATDSILAGLGKLQAKFNGLAASVLAVTLSGLSTSTNAAVVAGDSILAGIGKLQAQITALISGKADVASPTHTGVMTFPGAMTIVGTDMGSGTALDPAIMKNIKAVSANFTATVAAGAVAGRLYGAEFTFDGTARTITWPANFRDRARQIAITSTRFPANMVARLFFEFDGTNTYVSGLPGRLDNLSGGAAPTASNDNTQGYEVGSRWIYNGTEWVCTNAGTGAAVWADTTTQGSGGGSATNLTVTRDATTVTVNSSTGTEEAIPVATTTLAGVMSNALFTKLNDLPDNTTLNGALNNKRGLLGTPGASGGYTGDAFVGPNAAAGGLTQMSAVYITAAGTTALADANGSGTFPCVGLAVAAVAAGAAPTIIDNGIARLDSWTWTPGARVYLSGTAGGLTQTAPATAGDNIQCIGYAITATTIRVNIGSGEYVTRS